MGCVEPPPKIAAIPAGGLSLRLYVFGASAVEVRRTFASARRNNEGFRLVDGEAEADIVVGLEEDSPGCAPPTAVCSFRVVYRVRDKDGTVLDENSATMTSTSSSCTNVCSLVLRDIATKVIEAAAMALHPPSREDDAAPKPKSKRSPFCTLVSGARLASDEAEKRTLQIEALRRLSVLDAHEYDCLRKAYLKRL